jgi:hypothetical protein
LDICELGIVVFLRELYIPLHHYTMPLYPSWLSCSEAVLSEINTSQLSFD